MAKYDTPPNLLDNLLGGGVSIRSQLKYDYSLVPAESRDEVQRAAVAIIKAGRQAQESLIEVGATLIKIKDVLEHGQFEDWCETEFQMSPRTVQNMMNVARAFDGKSETVSLLTDSALYLLAAPSTPEAARAAVIEQAQASGQSPTKAEVKAVIAAHRPDAPRNDLGDELTEKLLRRYWHSYMDRCDLASPRLWEQLRRHLVESKGGFSGGEWSVQVVSGGKVEVWHESLGKEVFRRPPDAIFTVDRFAKMGAEWMVAQAERPRTPQPPVSPEQRQYEAAVPAWVPPGIPGARTGKPVPAVTLDDLPVVDSVTVRVDADGAPNMDWEPEEWNEAQRQLQAVAEQPPPVPADLPGWTLYHPNPSDWYLGDGIHATAYHRTPEQAFDEARRQQALWQVPPTPATKPGELPADLVQRGWQLRQVPGSGRWYGNNPNGPRATAIYDRPEDAVAACYDMQVDLRAAPAAAAPAQPQRNMPERGAVSLAVAGLDSAVRQMERAYEAVDGWDMDWCESLSQAIDLVRRLREELTA